MQKKDEQTIKILSKDATSIIDLLFYLRLWHGSAGHCILKPKKHKTVKYYQE